MPSRTTSSTPTATNKSNSKNKKMFVPASRSTNRNLLPKDVKGSQSYVKTNDNGSHLASLSTRSNQQGHHEHYTEDADAHFESIEVTLEMSLRTPQKFASASLIDVEITPSTVATDTSQSPILSPLSSFAHGNQRQRQSMYVASPQHPESGTHRSSSQCASTFNRMMCCNANERELQCCDADADDALDLSSVSPESVQQCIKSSLEDPSATACGAGQDLQVFVRWQTWACMMGDPTETTTSPIKPLMSQQSGPSGSNPDTAMSNALRHILNSRTNWRRRNTRALRIQQNLNPFDSNIKTNRNTNEATNSTRRPHSFSIDKHAPSYAAENANAGSSKKVSFASMLLTGCTQPTIDESPTKGFVSLDSFDPVDDNASYDSDPEYFMRTRRQSFDKENQRVTPINLMRAESDFNTNATKPSNSFKMPRKFSTTPREDSVFHGVAEEWMNSSITLILHDPKSARPVAVEAWVERGQRLRPNIVPPKFCWKTSVASRSVGDSTTRSKFPSATSPKINKIELLDIVRILATTERSSVNGVELDRKKFPLSKPQQCWILRGLGDIELILQAESRAERNRLVHGLKMLISRFGSKVLMADETVFDEFFANVIGGLDDYEEAREQDVCARYLRY